VRTLIGINPEKRSGPRHHALHECGCLMMRGYPADMGKGPDEPLAAAPARVAVWVLICVKAREASPGNMRVGKAQTSARLRGS